jgi:hypothetical protein
MIEDKSRSRSVVLLEELYNRTREEKLVWIDAGYDTTADESSPYRHRPTTHLGFKTQSGRYMLRIQLIPDFDFPNEPNFALYIISPDADEIIETISNMTLGQALDYKTTEGLTPYTLLQQIYEMARRQARHVEDVLEHVLESLRQQ